MPCFFPLAGYYSAQLNESGRRSIVFDKRKAHSGVVIPIPCGECIGCRLVEARTWAIRCVHEKRLHSSSAFLTLTYDDAHVPRGGNLVKRDVQLFMKRLRNARDVGVRFFACGEYGDRTGRPHYHVLLFNTFFPDYRFLKESPAGEKLYRSAELNELWRLGDCLIGDVTFGSCAYVAKYCLKKVGKPDVSGREPEFRLMSRRPGIGSGWYDRFGGEAYKHDSVIMEAREVPVPRFYDTKFEKIEPELLERLKRMRRARAMLHRFDNTYARRCVREQVEIGKAKVFARSL